MPELFLKAEKTLLEFIGQFRDNTTKRYANIKQLDKKLSLRKSKEGGYVCLLRLWRIA
jgi:hypothetical protein